MRDNRHQPRKRSKKSSQPRIIDGGYYGGHELTIGDSDSLSAWGGQKGSSKYVEELQKDLLKLGYWISDPETDSGMKVDGIFGPALKGAVKTFQVEENLKKTSIVDSETAKKIKESTTNSNFKRKGIKNNNGIFIQLPPSTDYKVEGYSYEGNNGEGILDHIWGTDALVNMLTATAKSWNNGGKDKLRINDMSLYKGGILYYTDKRAHTYHRKGTSVDLASWKYCNTTVKSFIKEDALELAKSLVQNGARIILFNCKYVIDNCDKVHACATHDNHMHVETEIISYHPGKACADCIIANCDYRPGREKADATKNPA